MSRYFFQPSTLGASSSSSCRTSGSTQIDSHGSTAAAERRGGASAPEASTPATSRVITSCSTASATARNRSALSANWWYIAPRVTPAAAAISGVPTSA